MARLSVCYILLAAFVVAVAAADPDAASLRGANAAQGKDEIVTETFAAPKATGYRVDWCSSYDAQANAFGGCGKDAADAFCRFVGFKESTAMEKDVNIKEPTILMLQLEVSPKPTHDSFKSITCMKTGTTAPAPGKGGNNGNGWHN